MDLFLDLLPKSPGLLPKWLLIISALALFNTVQNFATLKLTRRIYNNVPASSVTTLHARTFAIWTLTSTIVRFYAAYHLHDKHIYDIAFFTFLIAFGHFTSELLIFRTATISAAVLIPCIVSTTSLVWMFSQYDFYVQTRA